MIKKCRLLTLAIAIGLSLVGCKNNGDPVDPPVHSSVVSINVTHMPDKVEYELNETFDSTGLEITATRRNGTTSVLTTADYSLSGFSSTTIGTKYIIATYSLNKNISTQFTVHVSDSSSLISPTGITLNSSYSLTLGSTLTINPTFIPSNANTNLGVTWASSNPALPVNYLGIVGTTYSTQEGDTATITVTSTYDPTITASTTVTAISSSTEISPTGITLNSSYSIKMGETLTLTPTYIPNDANTNLGVTWSSSNPVLPISSTGVVGTTYSTQPGDSATITVTSTYDSSITATTTVTVAEEETNDWTIMLYVCGADLESGGSSARYATKDIKELLAVRNKQPDTVKIVVETGGASAWGMSNVSTSELGRYEINKDCSATLMKKVGSVSLASMGEASTLQNFIEWSVTNYPANHYGLFMWNHGGAMDGCCFDELFDDDSLSSNEVYTAVKNARTSLGMTSKFDFIAYDACLMAVQDIAEKNSYNFDYMLCSQETEWAGGYDYDASFPTLYANPSTVTAKTFLEKVADDFMDEQEGMYHNDQTQSVLDLSYMPTYLSAWENMTTELQSVVNSKTKWNTFANAVNKAMKYGKYDDEDAESYNDGYLYDIFDVKGALTQVKSTYSSSTTLVSSIDTVLSALDNVIVYNRCGSSMTGSNGLCLFCPISGYNLYEPYTYQGTTYPANYGTNDTNFTKWRSFCIQYGSWYN